jgi:hypothetical protein
VTAFGPVEVSRAYFGCPACGMGDYALDARLGLEGFLGPQARQFVCLAAADVSFAKAQRLLDKLLGWSVSDETIRQACYKEGAAMAAWQESSPQACQAFRAAAGEVEFQTDAAKVNTPGGWRDMKIGIFAKREPGEPATAEQWDERHLPGPTARVGFAAIETSEEFAARWRPWAGRLGVVDAGRVSVLGDGAEWIWNEAEAHFPGAAMVLDVYHAREHISDAGKALFGEGEEAQRWLRDVGQALIADGWWGLCGGVGEAMKEDDTPQRREAFEGLIGYFAKHTGRLGYCARLYQGRSIGSGMVEGAAKNMIGKRLKQTGARWEVVNVVRMASLTCLAYSSTWDAYWVTI